MIRYLRRALGRALRNTRPYRVLWRARNKGQWSISSSEERAYVDFFSSFLRPGSLCFDVGANIGNKTKLFLATGARVVAVEPQSNCVDFLKLKYGDNERVQIVQSAMGARGGAAKIYINSKASELSTLSTEWLGITRQHGRFSGQQWNSEEVVNVATLDTLIKRFGEPDFVKIDVEGFELQVIGGLSRPVKALSLEFAYEFLDPIFMALRRLEEMGEIETNYAHRKQANFSLENWVDVDALERQLRGLKKDIGTWGDVYARSKALSASK